MLRNNGTEQKAHEGDLEFDSAWNENLQNFVEQGNIFRSRC